MATDTRLTPHEAWNGLTSMVTTSMFCIPSTVPTSTKNLGLIRTILFNFYGFQIPTSLKYRYNVFNVNCC